MLFHFYITNRTRLRWKPWVVFMCKGGRDWQLNWIEFGLWSFHLSLHKMMCNHAHKTPYSYTETIKKSFCKDCGKAVHDTSPQ